MSRPVLEVADVICAQGNRFLERYQSSVSYQQLKAFRAICSCRTATRSVRRRRLAVVVALAVDHDGYDQSTTSLRIYPNVLERRIHRRKGSGLSSAMRHYPRDTDHLIWEKSRSCVRYRVHRNYFRLAV